MKILILNLVIGSILLAVRMDSPERDYLSQRLHSLRSWPLQRNRQPRH
jgi:hypothetical protein